MKALFRIIGFIGIGVVQSLANEPVKEVTTMKTSLRVVPHNASTIYLRCSATNYSNQGIYLYKASSPFSDDNTFYISELKNNRPPMMALGERVSYASHNFPPRLLILPSQQYIYHFTDTHKYYNLKQTFGFVQICWGLGFLRSTNIYIGFPDENGNIAPPVVDRPLRYHTRKHQIALAFIFNKNKPRELGFLVMNKLDEPFTAVVPLSARSRIIATAPAINYRRELFLPDKDIVELAVPSGEVAEWRLPWQDILDLIPKEDVEKIKAAGGDLDLVWKLDDEESPVLPMYLAPPESFKDSRIVPHPELENTMIIADPEP